MTVQDVVETATPLSVIEYRALVKSALDGQVLDWVARAEDEERFPRALIEHLGRTGVFADKMG